MSDDYEEVFANLNLAELADRLPYIYEELTQKGWFGRKFGDYSELVGGPYGRYPDYMASIYKDKYIKTIPHLGVEYKTSRGGALSVDKPLTLGIEVWETPNKIRYVFVNSRDGEGRYSQKLVINRNDFFPYLMHVKRMNSLAAKKTAVKPILEDSFIDEIVDESIGFFKMRRDLKKYKVDIKKGLIFNGSPGNGKTMLCKYIRALAGQNNIMCNNINASVIEEAFEFNNLDETLNFNGILFIDDIDISFLQRQGPKASIACSLLSAMSGLTGSGHTIRIFTTNEECSAVDQAFLRPGRIDKAFTFEKPTEGLRKRFIDTWHEDILAYLDGIDYRAGLVDDTHDMSFAEIDYIKSLLVENYLRNGEWDVFKAIEATKTRLEDNNVAAKQAIGFTGHSDEKRKKRGGRLAGVARPLDLSNL